MKNDIKTHFSNRISVTNLPLCFICICYQKFSRNLIFNINLTFKSIFNKMFMPNFPSCHPTSHLVPLLLPLVTLINNHLHLTFIAPSPLITYSPLRYCRTLPNYHPLLQPPLPSTTRSFSSTTSSLTLSHL